MISDWCGCTGILVGALASVLSAVLGAAAGALLNHTLNERRRQVELKRRWLVLASLLRDMLEGWSTRLSHGTANQKAAGSELKVLYDEYRLIYYHCLSFVNKNVLSLGDAVVSDVGRAGNLLIMSIDDSVLRNQAETERQRALESLEELLKQLEDSE